MINVHQVNHVLPPFTKSFSVKYKALCPETEAWPRLGYTTLQLNDDSKTQ